MKHKCLWQQPFLGIFAALLTAAFATGCGDGGADALLPKAAGTIHGESEIVKGETVVLSVDAIRNATAYRWYKDGDPVQDSGDRKLDVTLPGNYTVAGVNAFGEGVPSPVKEVREYVRPDIFIDRLVGDWSVKEIVVIDGKAYDNSHVIRMAYIDDSTVSIENFSQANAGPGTDFGDTVVAKVDNEAMTLTIPSTEFLPSWSQGVATILAPVLSSDFTLNIGLDFPVQTFVEVDGVLNLTMHTGEETVNVDGRICPVTYHVSAVSGTMYVGTFGYFVDTVWTKM